MNDAMKPKVSDIPTYIHLVQRYEWDIDAISDEAAQFAVRAALGDHALSHNAATATALWMALRERSQQRHPSTGVA